MNVQQNDTTDYITPLFTLLSYKIGALNNYDIKLIDYCRHSGLDTDTTIAVYLAQKRQDLEPILLHNRYNSYGLLANILRLKKLSAEKKFRQDYGINSDEQLRILIGKQTTRYQ